VVVVGRHARLLGNSRSVSLISRDVALVGHGLLRVHGHIGHVRVGHMRVLGHALPGSLGWKVLVGGLVGRFDLVGTINAVVITGGRLWRIKASLDQVLSLSLRNEGLQLWRCERVHKASLGHDKQQNLGAGKDRQFVCLQRVEGDLVSIEQHWR
jgi:hypothetical protein